MRLVLVTAFLLAPVSPLEAQIPLDTAFTYQGRLTDGGGPASGTYDFQLILFDRAVGGAQVGDILVRGDVLVANGLFTLSLDFGAAFAGSKRWLEIGVRPGASSGDYSTLSPRQELTPSPHAAFSAATPWSGITGKPAGFADDVDDDSGGDITEVSAGTGLFGGGTSGPVALAVDINTIQSRVTGTCAAGSSIRTISFNGTVSCETDDSGWSLTGNAGTSPATNFLGTTDGQALEIRVNSARAWRVEPTFGMPNLIGGFSGNSVTAARQGGSIGGGGSAAFPNAVTHDFGTVAGGLGNQAFRYSSVGGGQENRALGDDATIAGGQNNQATGPFSTVSGGWGNQATGNAAIVVGGGSNIASGFNATTLGGFSNQAGGNFSLAAGYGAQVRTPAQSGDADGDQGTFVWSDAETASGFQSTGPNQFLIKAAGGVGINRNLPSSALDVSGTVTMIGFRLLTGANSSYVLTSDGSGVGTWQPVDPNVVQSRVTGTCAPGSSVRAVNQDGSVDCEADDNSGGDVTGVAAGVGLTGGGASGDLSLAVNFAGTGVANTASRGDHDHYAQSWTGAVPGGPSFRVINTNFAGNSAGVQGEGRSGVVGISGIVGGRGVFGQATGASGFSDGVFGATSSVAGRGTVGYAVELTGANYGVWGQTDSVAGRGVYGLAAASSGTNYGVYGQTNSPTGYAGYFQGNVHVTGTLSKGAGSFKIDHPLDPLHKYLYHSFVESPDMKNIYDGVVTTDQDGLATVELPEWFEALNRDFRYQLTVLGDGDWARARVFRKMAGNRFVIQTDLPETEVSWQVTGIRQDSYANRHRIPVEEEKPEKERGTYLHPPGR